jgi:hypothetical protein
VRIEWRVAHAPGVVTIRFYDDAGSTEPTDRVSSRARSSIGPSVDEVDLGRSGSQPFAFTFWTDEAALSSRGYPGPA